MNKQRVQISSTEFRPLSDYILVKPHDTPKEETTQSGIVLQVEETALSRPTYGTVIAVGYKATTVAVNDQVLWPETDGLDVEFDDGYHVLLRYDSIIGKKK